MPATLTIMYAIIIASFALLVAIVVAVLCRRSLQSQSATIALLTKQIKATESERDSLRKELHELRVGTMGMGKRIKLIESQLVEAVERQEEIALTDPESRLYSRAVKMVELGADIEEVIAECEIPRAEAELLFNLHGGKS